MVRLFGFLQPRHCRAGFSLMPRALGSLLRSEKAVAKKVSSLQTYYPMTASEEAVAKKHPIITNLLSNDSREELFDYKLIIQ